VEASVPGEKFVDLAKEQTLYEFNEGGDVELMLERGPVNSRVNQDMARWCVAVEGVVANWDGPYQNLIDVSGSLQEMMLNLEGYSRLQAIEMKSRATLADMNAAEQQKKGGLLGLLGANK